MLALGGGARVESLSGLITLVFSGAAATLPAAAAAPAERMERRR